MDSISMTGVAWGTTYQRILLPDPAVKPKESIIMNTKYKMERTVPRIQSREPFFFHSSKVLP